MSPRAQPLELWVLPHSHADVGWLQTVNSLARVNVSRILDGVVSTLLANPARRFVWDEMAFLQYWWEHDASVAQRTAFRQLVRRSASSGCCVVIVSYSRKQFLQA